MPDPRRTRRRIASEKRRAKVTRPQLAALQRRAVRLRPTAVVVVLLAIAAALFVDTGMGRIIVILFGAGVAAFLALTTLLRCPACLTSLDVEEKHGPMLPKKVRCPHCDMRAPYA